MKWSVTCSYIYACVVKIVFNFFHSYFILIILGKKQSEYIYWLRSSTIFRKIYVPITKEKNIEDQSTENSRYTFRRICLQHIIMDILLAKGVNANTKLLLGVGGILLAVVAFIVSRRAEKLIGIPVMTGYGSDYEKALMEGALKVSISLLKS